MRYSYQKGFTLLELIVAVGVFTVVATLSVGALLILTDAERKAFNLQTNQDNARFAIESMVREIRTGINYSTSHDQCVGFRGCFTFINSDARTVVYRLNGNIVEKWVDDDGNNKINNGESFLPLTGSEVTVSSLKFILPPEECNSQPRLTIIMELATPGTGPLSTATHVQTSVSQLKLGKSCNEE